MNQRKIRGSVPLFVPIGVVVLLIGAVIWFVADRRAETTSALESAARAEEPDLPSDPISGITPINETDHILGNPNAPLVFIVYSDYQCPFCAEHHTTMQGVMDMLGREGDIAWVHRQLPMVDLHPQAPMYALASECVAAYGGNRAFWNFSDDLYDAVEPDRAPGAEELIALARRAGVDPVEFANCMRNNEFMDRVEADFVEAIKIGASATPYTVIMSDEEPMGLAGAQPLPEFVTLVNALIKAGEDRGLTAPSESTFDSSAFERFADPVPSPTEATTTPAQEESLVPMPEESLVPSI